MSHWNYRVISKHHEESDSTTLQVHEVHYDDAGRIEGWTQSPVGPSGESIAELRSDIDRFLEALQKPVLTEATGGEKLIEDPRSEIRRRTDTHPKMGKIEINYDPTEPLTADEINEKMALLEMVKHSLEDYVCGQTQPVKEVFADLDTFHPGGEVE